jgi:hypothetical protein
MIIICGEPGISCALPSKILCTPFHSIPIKSATTINSHQHKTKPIPAGGAFHLLFLSVISSDMCVEMSMFGTAVLLHLLLQRAHLTII